MPTRLRLVAVAAFIGVNLGAASAVAQAERAWVKVEDQAVAASTVQIEDVNMPSAGWIVVHAADNKGEYQEGHIIGHVAVKPGNHGDVSVPLNRPVKAGDRLFITLHTDKGTRGRFEFDAATGFADDPFVVGGVPVIAKFSVK